MQGNSQEAKARANMGSRLTNWHLRGANTVIDPLSDNGRA